MRYENALHFFFTEHGQTVHKCTIHIYIIFHVSIFRNFMCNVSIFHSTACVDKIITGNNHNI